MLKNANLLAKIGADTAENEQHFAKNLPKTGNYPTGRELRLPQRLPGAGRRPLEAPASPPAGTAPPRADPALGGCLLG